jgi:hypothetical protein
MVTGAGTGTAEVDATLGVCAEHAQELAVQARRQKSQGSSALRPPVELGEVVLESKARQSRRRRQATHWNTRVSERIATLEAIFRNILSYSQ